MSKQLTNEPPCSIAIFDSGCGGLLTLDSIYNRFKDDNKNFIYFADSKNVPYGSKSKEEILNLTMKIVEYLQMYYSPKLIINACNTSTSASFEEIQKSPQANIMLNIIHPFINAIDFNYKKICIMATSQTIKSKFLCEELLKANPKIDKIFECPCSDLASLIEDYLLLDGGVATDCISDGESFENSKRIDNNITRAKGEEIISKKICEYFSKNNIPKDEKIDFLIYGCSHYPHAGKIIEKFLQKNFPNIIQIIDPMEYLVNEGVKKIKEFKQKPHLETNNRAKNLSEKSNITFIINGDIEGFKKKLQNCMKSEINSDDLGANATAIARAKGDDEVKVKTNVPATARAIATTTVKAKFIQVDL